MYKKLFLIFIFLFIFFPSHSFSAQSYFFTTYDIYGVGQEFIVDVLLNTEGRSINAVEGSISFPESLEIKDLDISNSTLNFWVDKPKITSKGTISFSGITPGGVLSDKVELFKILVKAVDLDRIVLQFKNIQVLANDGNGTILNVKSTDLLLEIKDGLDFKNNISNKPDTTPPDDFKPEIGNDQSTFDNQYFIAFLAQDKESGIDHYEIKEGFFDDYIVADSPYLLKNKNFDKKIYIKAIDKEGNERVVKYIPQNFKPFYLDKFILGIILFSIILFSFLIKFLWLKFIH